MGKKICVYAICKNEIKFVRRWMDSMAEADGIYVLDTGSTDSSAELLEELGAHVERQTIEPWRFDRARNASLELVPEDTDICVCTDLDEVFQPGWREKLERAWLPGVERAGYRYTWNFLPDGREGTVFIADKIHSRFGWRWVNPVHEVLERTASGPFISAKISGMRLYHHADGSKSRAQYLPLLELAVRERPEDDRNLHYLGREYMFRGMWQECIETLERHLLLPGATWKDERSASMRYIARAKRAQGKSDEAMLWLFRAVAEAPWLREGWLDASELALERQDYALCLYFAKSALEIKERAMTYIDQSGSWGERPYDLAAVACFYLGRYEQALEYGIKALEFAPEDHRLRSNLVHYREKAGS